MTPVSVGKPIQQAVKALVGMIACHAVGLSQVFVKVEGAHLLADVSCSGTRELRSVALNCAGAVKELEAIERSIQFEAIRQQSREKKRRQRYHQTAPDAARSKQAVFCVAGRARAGGRMSAEQARIITHQQRTISRQAGELIVAYDEMDKMFQMLVQGDTERAISNMRGLLGRRMGIKSE